MAEREIRVQPIGATVEARSDRFWELRGAERWDTLVAWYLSASVAYYHWDETFMPDDDYDLLCFDLYKNFETLNHPHKHLLDKEALLAGTAYHLKEHEYPLMTRRAAWVILNPRDTMCRKMPEGHVNG